MDILTAAIQHHSIATNKRNGVQKTKVVYLAYTADAFTISVNFWDFFGSI